MGRGSDLAKRASERIDYIMKGIVYVLRNKSGNLYIGSTTDLQRRLRQHLKGHTQTTKNREMIELVLSQEYESLAIARKIERKIKKLKRKDYVEKIVADGYIKMTPK